MNREEILDAVAPWLEPRDIHYYFVDMLLQSNDSYQRGWNQGARRVAVLVHCLLMNKNWQTMEHSIIEREQANKAAAKAAYEQYLYEKESE